ncbi:hypothetical protein [Chakrabartyella piscis]|uniref:hypothetical protein n=1 Tax=Chakrabartyella piscis TaxID=2918914 RepID=UPI002958C43D|nr:hypothetical protein [Chakrabartyella piscis]
MLGFHTDGVCLIGASKDLLPILKKRKIPITKTITTNTLVFAINNSDYLDKKRFSISFMAGETPWFVCTVGDFTRPTANTLSFATNEDLVDFITAIYYASQGFLHLDFELSYLKQQLSVDNGRKIRALEETGFTTIPKNSFAACFCFTKGGFMESDRLFTKLTKEYGLEMDKVLLTGTFDSKYQFIRAFLL